MIDTPAAAPIGGPHDAETLEDKRAVEERIDEHWQDYTPDETDHHYSAPLECDYALRMWDDGGGSSQQVQVTREEFIALEAHLAAMRSGKFSDEQIGQIFDVHLCDAQLIRAAAIALRNNSGCDTPAEDFLWNILITYEIAQKEGYDVKPEHIEGDLKEFRRSLEKVVDSAKGVHAEYPDLLAQSAAPEGGRVQ